MTTMKAVRVHEYGGVQAMRYEDAPRPFAGAGELLVRVVAAGVNPIDWKVRAGHLKAMVPLRLPWIPGVDFAGVVEVMGEGVTDVRVGDEVFGKTDLPRDGSYAEYVAVARTSVAPRPRTVDHVHAAVVPLAALTAWQGLSSLELAPGKTLLVVGAAGGVGSFAVQLAKVRGARVFATARTGEENYVRSLGADRVIDAAHLDEDGEVDAVLDLVGGDVQKRAIACLRRGGAVASTMGQPSPADVEARGARGVAISTRSSGPQLGEIAALIDAGKVKVIVAETLSLSAAVRAHELLEAGGVRGKLALSVARG